MDINNKNFTTKIIKKRARHVVTENQRVLEAKKALINDDINYFGQLMNESHKSYSVNFEASNKNIDKITQRSLDSGAIGSRLTGGGFGGFVVSLIKYDCYAEWKSKMLNYYDEKSFLEC